MNLAQLQQAFQERVLHGSTVIDTVIQNTASVDVKTRLGIYEFAFGARLIEAVAKTYPALQAVMGEQKFARLIREYAYHKPPSHFSIRHFGDDLSSFIAEKMKGIRATGLSELAHWEWLLATAFDAADVASLTRDALASIAPDQWPQLRFKLSPSFSRITLHTNAVPWWKAVSDDSQRPTRWRMIRKVEWAIWRSELKTYFRSLKTDEAQAVDCVARGDSFATLCEVLAEYGHADNAPLRAATLLSQWFNDGWIVGLPD
ncbi:MAG: DNA-binding domain-containing protein [Steroidobacter sp.]